MTATAGATSTTPAATSPDGDAGRPAGARLHLLGIRHHGPGSARSVRRALDALRPDVVLVEAPADADAALRWIGARRASCRRSPCSATSSPSPSGPCSPRSPSSARSGRPCAGRSSTASPVEAIDLPLASSLAAGDDAAPTLRRGRRPPPDPLGDARRGRRRARRRALVGGPRRAPRRRRAGVRRRRRGDGRGARRHRDADRSTPCGRRTCAGASAPPSPTARVVAVVCGAWHVPALDPAVDHGDGRRGHAARPAEGQGRRHVGAVDPPPARPGHRATAPACVSPGWYDHVFRHPGPEGVSRFFVDAAHALRRRGMPASPDHLIAASRLADSLAALRRRPRAGLAEVLDAAESVLGGLPLVVDELVVGDAIGEVPPEAPAGAAGPRPGRRASGRPGSKPEADDRTVELDLRTPNGLRRSHLLHRLVALGVPWGTLEEGRGLERHVPRDVAAGVGARAVGARRRAGRPRHDGRGGGDVAARRAGRPAPGGWPTPAPPSSWRCSPTCRTRSAPAVRVLGELAARAPDVAELMDALGPLAGALRYGDVRGTDAAGAARRVRRARRAGRRRAGPGRRAASTTTRPGR